MDRPAPAMGQWHPTKGDAVSKTSRLEIRRRLPTLPPPGARAAPDHRCLPYLPITRIKRVIIDLNYQNFRRRLGLILGQRHPGVRVPVVGGVSLSPPEGEKLMTNHQRRALEKPPWPGERTRELGTFPRRGDLPKLGLGGLGLA